MGCKLSPVFLVFLLVSLVISGFQIVEVEAQEEKIFGKNTLPNWLTVTVNEDSDVIIIDNNDGFLFKFRKGTSGYNEIWENNTQIVANEQWVLQYLSQSKWKQRGIPQYVTWEQPQPYHVVVKRFYNDFLGTTFNVSYDFYGGFRPKIMFEGFIAQEDDYRIKWAISGINKTYVSEKANSVEFWNEDEIPIVFDYEDVYMQFGEITSVELDPWANNHKLNQVFNVGVLGIGEFGLDPTFGKTDKGGSSMGDAADVLYGTKFALSETGDVSAIDIYLYATSGSRPFQCYIYSDNAGAPDALEAVTEEKILTTMDGFISFSISPTIELAAGDYWLSRNHDSGGACIQYYDAGDANQHCYKNGITYVTDTPPNPFGTPTGYAARNFSIYATYTPVVAGQDLTFALFENFNVWASTTKTIETSNTFYQNFNTWETIAFNKEISFKLYEPFNLWSYLAINKEQSFTFYEAFNLWSSITMASEGVALDLYFTLFESFNAFASLGTVLEEELTLNDVYGLAALAFVMAIVGICLAVALKKK